jgi:hypothetical protein
MEHPSVVTVNQPRTCECVEPQPKQFAERKGAARTVCAKCGLPTKIAWQR